MDYQSLQQLVQTQGGKIIAPKSSSRLPLKRRETLPESNFSMQVSFGKNTIGFHSTYVDDFSAVLQCDDLVCPKETNYSYDQIELVYQAWDFKRGCMDLYYWGLVIGGVSYKINTKDRPEAKQLLEILKRICERVHGLDDAETCLQYMKALYQKTTNKHIREACVRWLEDKKIPVEKDRAMYAEVCLHKGSSRLGQWKEDCTKCMNEIRKLEKTYTLSAPVDLLLRPKLIADKKQYLQRRLAEADQIDTFFQEAEETGAFEAYRDHLALYGCIFNICDYCKEEETLRNTTFSYRFDQLCKKFEAALQANLWDEEIRVEASDLKAEELRQRTQRKAELLNAIFTIGNLQEKYFHNPTVASSWYERGIAAESGESNASYADACYYVARCYLDGIGGKEKRTPADATVMDLLKKSAEHECADAQYELAKWYYDRGDEREGQKWEQRAHANGKKKPDWGYEHNVSETATHKLGVNVALSAEAIKSAISVAEDGEKLINTTATDLIALKGKAMNRGKSGASDACAPYNDMNGEEE
jgi:hypothetical protein